LKTPKNTFFWKTALTVSTVVTLLVVVLAWVIHSSNNKPPPRSTETARLEVPLAPRPLGELLTIRTAAWQAIKDNYINFSQLSNWDSRKSPPAPLTSEAQLHKELQGLLAPLNDKYSVAMSNRGMRTDVASQSGRAADIGIKVDDNNTVTDVPANSPAAKAGIKAGDIIILAGDMFLFMPLPADMVYELLRGPYNSTVVIAVRHKDGTGLYVGLERTFTTYDRATRSGSQDGVYSLRVDNMRNPQLVPEITKILTDFNRENAKVMILDLRAVNGGSGETAAQVAALFLSDGPICHVRKRSKGKESEASYVVRNRKIVLVGGPQDVVLDGQAGLFSQKVLILVDEKTSGAGEIIASALQESGRARVYGMVTAGKSSGQTYIDIGYGYVLRLTTSIYTTAKRNPIGVKPDVVVEVVEEADRNFVYDKALEEAESFLKAQAADTLSLTLTALVDSLGLSTTTTGPAAPTTSITATSVGPSTNTTPTAPSAPTTSVGPSINTTSTAPSAPTTSVGPSTVTSP